MFAVADKTNVLFIVCADLNSHNLLGENFMWGKVMGGLTDVIGRPRKCEIARHYL